MAGAKTVDFVVACLVLWLTLAAVEGGGRPEYPKVKSRMATDPATGQQQQTFFVNVKNRDQADAPQADPTGTADAGAYAYARVETEASVGQTRARAQSQAEAQAQGRGQGQGQSQAAAAAAAQAQVEAAARRSEPARRVSAPGCRECEVNGQQFPGHSRFQFEDGCNRFNCICRCDGSYDCPASHTENICEAQTGGSSASNGGGGGRGGCVNCRAKGQEFQGNSYFDLTDGCFAYTNCICRCDGSWECPPERGRNICEDGSDAKSSSAADLDSQASAGGCRRCQVDGQEFEGNSYFNHRSGCYQYTDCICRCDGSWECPPERGRDICRDSSSSSSSSSSPSSSSSSSGGCRTCNAEGTIAQGNSYFDLTMGCIQYRSCICRCDGSWECPPERGTVICDDTDDMKGTQGQRGNLGGGGGSGGTSGSSSTGGTSGTARGCRQCNANGTIAEGNSYFNHQQGCIFYESCLCRCDGSWECSAERARDVCVGDASRRAGTDERTAYNLRREEERRRQQQASLPVVQGIQRESYANRSRGSSVRGPTPRGEAPASTLEQRRRGCIQCVANEKPVPGNSYFNLLVGCFQYEACLCHCDGSWECDDERSENVCDFDKEDNQDILPEVTCRECVVDGRQVAGNSYFERREGCKLYQGCVCGCDGRWECSEDRVVDTCVTQQPQTGGCKQCDAKGKLVPGNSYFDLADGCTEFQNCICRCDGSWDCSGRPSRDICQPAQCQSCSVYGNFYTGNSSFVYEEGCLQYHCQCNCDGTWLCPSDRTVDTCAGGCQECEVRGEFFEGNSYFTQSEGCTERTCFCYCNGTYDCPRDSTRNTCTDSSLEGCSSCRISEGKVYPGNSDFEITEGCTRYRCRCNCDGGWDCPASRSENTCDTRPQTTARGCRTCQVAPGETYEGGTEFQMRRECVLYQCRCNCDGSVECPGNQARDICVGEQPGSCRVCQVSQNEVYRGGSDFQQQRGCLLYNCRCNCDGSWNCPADQARNVCRSEVPGPCRSCLVDGRYVPADRKFVRRHQCVRSECMCRCDGTFQCDASTESRYCTTPGRPCRQCVLSDEQVYEGNSNFTMERGCLRYQCRCDCDGTHTCPPSQATDVCREREQARIDPRTCRPCQLAENTFPGNSPFHLTRGCYKFSCKCDCDGRWSCDRENVENVCDATRRPDPRPLTRPSRPYRGELNDPQPTDQQCQQCQVHGKLHDGDTQFRFRRGCIEYQCICRCNGNWECPGDTAVDACKRERGSVDPINFRSGPCTTCDVDNVKYEAGTQFDMRRGCIRYKCTCRCDGSYGCHVTADDECHFGEPAACRNCFVEGLVFPGNHGFKTRRGCDELTCRCNCDGTWNCDPSKTRNWCGGVDPHDNTPILSDTEYAGAAAGAAASSQAQAGAYPGGRTQTGTQTATYTSGAGRRVQQQHGYTAMKYGPSMTPGGGAGAEAGAGASASAMASASAGAYAGNGMTQPGRMRNGVARVGYGTPIMVDAGKLMTRPRPLFPGFPAPGSLPGGDDLRHMQPMGAGFPGGFGSQAYSSAHSSASASGGSMGSARYDGGAPYPKAGSGHQIIAQGSYSEHSGTGLDLGQCQQCVVEGNTYRGNSSFQVTKDCVQYDCVCECSGSWKCSGRFSTECQAAEPEGVRGQTYEPGTCRPCKVEKGEHPPNSDFKLQQGCFQYSCRCNCDGTWMCPTQTPVALCSVDDPRAPLPPSTCRPCVARGTEYEPDSTFMLREGCTQYTCRCNCGGDWRCPAEQAVDVCKAEIQATSDPGTPPGGDTQCQACHVNGRNYISQADFKYREGCFQHQCHCHCNGTHECPEEKKLNLCRSPDYRIDGCRPCEIRNQTYPGGSPFQYREGCWEFNCQCSCNGISSCPPDMSRDLCKDGNTISNRCRPCIIDGKVIKSKSTFNMRRGCREFLCDCNCDGSWDCPQDKSLNICEGGDQGQGQTADLAREEDGENFAGCRVGRRHYFTRLFSYTEDCVRYSCICYGNGAWTCPTRHNKRIC